MAWTASKKITIDHTKVGATLTDYPLLFTGTYTYLKTTGNGGDVTSSSAYDIIFTSDSAGLTQIPFERVFHNITTGAVEYHIKVASVSSSVDTDIYIFYGNAAVTTDQSSVTAVWDTNFKLIQHLGDGTTINVADSTGINTPSNNGATATAGQFGGAAAFNGSSQYIDDGSNSALNITGTTITLECWYKANSPNIFARLISRMGTGNTSGYQLLTWTVGTLLTIEFQNSGTRSYFTANNFLTNGVWYHITTVLNSGTIIFYINGSSQSSAFSENPTTGNISSTSINLNIARFPGAGDGFISGSLDEIRISTNARASGWVTACYNNQSSPSTFYTLTSNAVSVPLTLSSSDSVNLLSESVTNSGYARVAFTKSETINNFLDGLALIGGDPDYHLQFGDKVNLQDFINLTPKITKVFADTINLLTESVTVFIGIPVKAFDSQFFNWADSVNTLYAAVLKQLPSDTLNNLLDSATVVRRNVPILIATGDTINNIHDALRLFDTLTAILGDTFVISDAVRLRFNHLLKISEVLTSLLETVRFRVESRPNFSDSFTLTDSATLRLTANLRITKSDTLSFSDAVVKSLVGTYSQVGFLERLRRYLNDLN